MTDMTQCHSTETEMQNREATGLQAQDRIWVLAVLVETLVLLGGLLWVFDAPQGLPLTTRIVVVTALAVLGSSGFVYAAAHRHSGHR